MRRGPNPKKKVRILVADREGVFRFGLKKLFGLEDDLRIVAQAENREQTLAMARSFKPDLLFLQGEITAEVPGDILATLRQELPKCKIVITASTFSDEEASRFVNAGVAGLILKSSDPGLFVKGARKVMENELWMPRRQAVRAAQAIQSAPPTSLRPVETLTRREKTIISYLMQGCRNREIAQQLSIREQTVKNHLRTIYDKVGVSDRLELVLYAIHQRLEIPSVPPAAVQTA